MMTTKTILHAPAASREWGYVTTYDQRLTASDLTPDTRTDIAGIIREARDTYRARQGSPLRWRYGVYYDGRLVRVVRTARNAIAWWPGFPLHEMGLDEMARRDGELLVEVA